MGSRTHYPSIDGLLNAGRGVVGRILRPMKAFSPLRMKSRTTHGLRGVMHNASTWLAERPVRHGPRLAMLQIHVHAPYLLDHTLPGSAAWGRNAAGDVIHFTDYVVSAVAINISPTRPAKRHWMI
ncbi:hypothetical protein ACNKHO_10190 [Shigella flexneri]